jgi:hypothetical protein
MTVADILRRIESLQKRLPRQLKAECPGEHRYVKWQVTRPAWCRHCGYSRDGQQFGVVGPAAQAARTDDGPPSLGVN